MNCSKCGSSNCRSFEMVNQSGTSSGDGTAYAQTDLARRCSPPKNGFLSMGVGASWIAGILALPVGCMSTTMSGTHFPANVGFGFMAMFVTTFALIIIIKATSSFLGFTSKHEHTLHRWNNSFMCLDCGNVIVHEQIVREPN